ncbi:GNAT family N-acetyltransferase [Brevibacillus brevis]|uniref:GNAT family N-acetyltransferase n=1 Tax=Brevibacillus brevis TaxID=1393 RepID=A0ABY9TBQ9_BREBE|nr:GNAT family N-acetyltransferase [Brevibacillus brevis]WNC17543.1 GNAT family N-acetyltransferase [Brevibacillus brevis]
MKVITTGQWEEELWYQAEAIYNAAFPEDGRKSRGIIRNMFAQNLCYLHVGYLQGQAIAMAITGKTEDSRALIIDYFAVDEKRRGTGIGGTFLEEIKKWAIALRRIQFLLIEVESDESEENDRRSRFWGRHGFRSTAYVHQYIWVPEPYRAMYLPLIPGQFAFDGQELFASITRFHQKSFKWRKEAFGPDPTNG